jgi:hypothetical protein
MQFYLIYISYKKLYLIIDIDIKIENNKIV